MERTYINLTGLRTKLAAIGKTQHDLAQAASLPDSAVSSILHGREYLGRVRAGRLQDALHRLTLEVEAKRTAEAEGETPAAATPPKTSGEPRIRRL